MKKYYGYFIYKDREYVIRFKVSGIAWRPEHKCFIDDKWYVRSAEDMICLAAFDSHPLNIKNLGFSCLLTKKQYIEKRIHGVERWNPVREKIIWES